jgi:D-glycero-D-manno-heptose 1,7-bisphosphate phosphatase
MGVAAPAGSPRPQRPALFVDRDGTLDPDLHYLKDPDRLELFRGVGRSIALARSRRWLVVCVTNQSGVERGLYTDAEVHAIHARMNDRLARDGTRIDAFYYCPHAPEHGCRCRKPGTELFERARADLSIDLGSSAIVGDRVLDTEAGRRLGLLTALVRLTGHAREVDAEFHERHMVPDIVADSFEGAVLRVLARG